MNQAGMNQNIPDSLSAGIDGELSKEQLRFLLRRLDHDVPRCSRRGRVTTLPATACAGSCRPWPAMVSRPG